MKKSNILETLRKCFRNIFSNTLKTGQKVTSLKLVTILILYFQGDRKGFSLENIRMALYGQLNILLSKSSFWERLGSKQLTELLEILMKKIMSKMIIAPLRAAKLIKELNINKIVMIDSSTISLWDMIAKKNPGTWTLAGIKLHACVF